MLCLDVCVLPAPVSTRGTVRNGLFKCGFWRPCKSVKMKVSGSNLTAADPESLIGCKNLHCRQTPACDLLCSLRVAVLRNILHMCTWVRRQGSAAKVGQPEYINRDWYVYTMDLQSSKNKWDTYSYVQVSSLGSHTVLNEDISPWDCTVWNSFPEAQASPTTQFWLCSCISGHGDKNPKFSMVLSQPGVEWGWEAEGGLC